MIFVVIIFSILFLALALYRLDWALFAIIVGLPTYLIRFNILGLPLTLLEVMIIIAFGVWFCRMFLPNIKGMLQKSRSKARYPYSIEIILVLLISWLAVGTNGWNISALGIWKAYFFEPILVYILFFNLIKEKKNWINIIYALSLSATLVSLFALFQQATGLFIANPFWANIATRRVVSFFGYPNAVGLYLAPIIMIMSGYFFSLNWKNGIFKNDRLKKIFFSLTIATSLASIYFAQSEGAMIGLAVGLFIMALLGNKKSRIIALTLFIVGGMAIYFYPPVKNIFIEKATLSDLSGSIRKQQWKETFKMLNDGRLITGAGLSGYKEAVSPFHQEGIFWNSDHLANFDAQLHASSTLRAKYWQPVEVYLYPHNIFLNFWSELGIFGVLLFTWILLKYLFLTFKLSLNSEVKKNQEQYLILGLASAIVVIIIHGLVDVPYFKNDLSVMFWIIIALGAAQRLNYKKQK